MATNCVKLSKLKFNNFLSFGNVEIEFKKLTTFNFNIHPNGKCSVLFFLVNDSSAYVYLISAITNFFEGLKFLLNCSLMEQNDLRKNIQDYTMMEEDEM
jgi:hypothetical protein